MRDGAGSALFLRKTPDDTKGVMPTLQLPSGAKTHSWTPKQLSRIMMHQQGLLHSRVPLQLDDHRFGHDRPPHARAARAWALM